jgi:hypothetical protein
MPYASRVGARCGLAGKPALDAAERQPKLKINVKGWNTKER